MAQEAKQYAQRNREGSNWFSHDSGPAKPVSSEPAAKPVPSEPTAKPVPSEPAVAATTEAPATAVENNADKSPTAAEPAVPPAPAPAPARAQMIRPKCDSNEWFVLTHCCHYLAQLLRAAAYML